MRRPPASPRRTSPPTGCSSPALACSPACRCWSRGRAEGWRPPPSCSASRRGSWSTPPPGTPPSAARPRRWERRAASIPATSRPPESWSGRTGGGRGRRPRHGGGGDLGSQPALGPPGGYRWSSRAPPAGRIPGPSSTGSSGASSPLPGPAWARVQELEQLVGLCASGALRPLVDRVVPLEDARSAFAIPGRAASSGASWSFEQPKSDPAASTVLSHPRLRYSAPGARVVRFATAARWGAASVEASPARCSREASLLSGVCARALPRPACGPPPRTVGVQVRRAASLHP